MAWTGGPRSYIVYDSMDTDDGNALTVEDSLGAAQRHDGHGYVFGYDMVTDEATGQMVAENETFYGMTRCVECRKQLT